MFANANYWVSTSHVLGSNAGVYQFSCFPGICRRQIGSLWVWLSVGQASVESGSSLCALLRTQPLPRLLARYQSYGKRRGVWSCLPIHTKKRMSMSSLIFPFQTLIVKVIHILGRVADFSIRTVLFNQILLLVGSNWFLLAGDWLFLFWYFGAMEKACDIVNLQLQEN